MSTCFVGATCKILYVDVVKLIFASASFVGIHLRWDYNWMQMYLYRWWTYSPPYIQLMTENLAWGIADTYYMVYIILN